MMLKIFYFLVGVFISFVALIPFAKADCGDVSSLSVRGEYVGHFADKYAAKAAARVAINAHVANITCDQGSALLGSTYNNSVNGVYYGAYSGTYKCCNDGACVDMPVFSFCTYGSILPCAADSDGDGIIDDHDLKPNSSESYKAAIVSICYDSNNKVVAGVIQDGEGNQYSFGTVPTDFEGYTFESITGELVTYQTPEALAASLEKLNIDDLNITNQNKPIEIQDDGTIIPGSTDPFKDYKDKEDDQTEAKKPETQTPSPSEQPDSNDSDSDRNDKIIKNTAATNTNLDNIQKYLGITNDYLAKINGKSSSSSKSSSSAVVNVETPTADEIGQAVENELIDSGQTIDKTITDNISDLDKTDALASIKTKYSDRYTSFITTLKGSDLFSLPFSIFSGPSGSGASMQTVDIGKWGSSNEQTATIDYSDYDNIWEILRSVLLLLTSFSCFKILVLKKG